MRTIQLWGEGVAGDVYMEGKRFYASGCANTKSSAKPSKVVAFNSTCVGGGVQPKLRFNLTNNSAALASFPFPLPSEVPSLPDAICCDPDFSEYAEPANLFQDPSVSLFTR